MRPVKSPEVVSTWIALASTVTSSVTAPTLKVKLITRLSATCRVIPVCSAPLKPACEGANFVRAERQIREVVHAIRTGRRTSGETGVRTDDGHLGTDDGRALLIGDGTANGGSDVLRARRRLGTASI